MAAREDQPLSSGSSTAKCRGEMLAAPLGELRSIRRRSARAAASVEEAPPPRAHTSAVEPSHANCLTWNG